MVDFRSLAAPLPCWTGFTQSSNPRFSRCHDARRLQTCDAGALCTRQHIGLSKAAYRPALLLEPVQTELRIVVEFLQQASGLRRGDIHDVYANAIGIVLGALTALTPARTWLLAIDRRISRTRT